VSWHKTGNKKREEEKEGHELKKGSDEKKKKMVAPVTYNGKPLPVDCRKGRGLSSVGCHTKSEHRSGWKRKNAVNLE